MEEIITVVAFVTLTVTTPQGQFANKTKRQSEHVHKPEGVAGDILYARFMITCRWLNMAESMDCHLLRVRIQFCGILHYLVAAGIVIAIEMHDTNAQWAKKSSSSDKFET